MTVLAPHIADRHEAHGPTCLIAPDGDTCCPHPATWRFDLEPANGYGPGPSTFACTPHALHLAARPDIATVRNLQP